MQIENQRITEKNKREKQLNNSAMSQCLTITLKKLLIVQKQTTEEVKRQQQEVVEAALVSVIIQTSQLHTILYDIYLIIEFRKIEKNEFLKQ